MLTFVCEYIPMTLEVLDSCIGTIKKVHFSTVKKVNFGTIKRVHFSTIKKVHFSTTKKFILVL